MSGFIAQPATHTPQPIAADAFWPVIDLASVARDQRIGGEVSPERLRAALVHAILNVNDQLADWQARQQAAGYARLADVPAPQVAGQSRLITLYQRAVACAVLAEIAERYRSFDASAQGHARADDLAPNIDEARRDLRWAIRDFLGRPRTTVELI